MKASFFVTLLALCLCAGAADLPKLGRALAFRKHRDVLTAAFDAGSGQVSNSASKQNTSHFYPIIEYGYIRAIPFSTLHYGVSIQKCIEYCRMSDSCLFINYHAPSRKCYEYQTMGSLSPNSAYSTCLVNYKKGDDPCDDGYALKGYTRLNYIYEYFAAAATPTHKDCCIKCRDDPESKCKAWTYHISSKYCRLFDGTPALTNSSSFISGYTVVDSDGE